MSRSAFAVRTIRTAKELRQNCGTTVYLPPEFYGALLELLDAPLYFGQPIQGMIAMRPSQLDTLIAEAEKTTAERVADELQHTPGIVVGARL